MAFRTPADPNALVYVAFNGHVIALRPGTGERVWSHDGETGLSRVLVEGDFVYVLQSLSVVCLDAATGRLIWQAGCDAGYTLQNAANLKAVPLDAAALERFIPDGASINVIARPSPPPE